jgi:hypothetical protein
MRPFVALLALSPALAHAAPTELVWQGRLLDAAGAPISGEHDVSFSLYAAAEGGTPLWSETDRLTLADGHFSTVLGDGSPLGGVIGEASRYLGIAVDGVALAPRQVLVGVPYAIRAREAERVLFDATTPCDAAHVGLFRWTGDALTLCVAPGSERVVSSDLPVDGSSPANAGASCLDLLEQTPALQDVDALYWIDPNGGTTADAYQVWCDMSTDNGGWTLVMNVAPTDGNSAGFNNQSFWTTDAPFGSTANRFSHDFKSPAAYEVVGTHLMIQSANTGASGAVLGWRRWPMSPRTLDSFFAVGIPPVHATDSCETGASDLVSLGSTSSWDDIIRQGSCLYADVNPSNSGEGDTIRLTTIPGNSTDNKMSGFASCIDCGQTWQGVGKTYAGFDRAACNRTQCHYNEICRMPSADCVGNYCTDGTYPTTSCGSAWNSRFYVR